MITLHFFGAIILTLETQYSYIEAGITTLLSSLAIVFSLGYHATVFWMAKLYLVDYTDLLGSCQSLYGKAQIPFIESIVSGDLRFLLQLELLIFLINQATMIAWKLRAVIFHDSYTSPGSLTFFRIWEGAFS